MIKKLAGTIKDIQHYFKIEGSYLLYVDKQFNLKCVSKDDLKEIWNFEGVYNFFLNTKYVVCGIIGNEQTVILNLYSGKKVNKYDFDLNIKGTLTESCYYGSTFRNGEPVILKFDLAKNDLAGIFPSLLGIRTIIDDMFYLSVQKKRILTKRIIENDSVNWKFDITQFGTYKENKIFADQEVDEKQREIKRVYYQKGKVIITLSRAIIALDPMSGKLLWKIDFEDYNPIDIIFDDNKAYLGDIAYYVIDIDKGEVILKSRFDENIEIEGDKIRWVTSGSGLVLHQGFLWCVFGENKRCYLAKINPVSGKLLDAMSLDTQAPSAKPPVFNENRVYILDQDGELFIYEEQI
jgi:outer membrane protein assembly factor BamB